MAMKLTKERKVYAAVAGLGLLALVVDRALLAPSSASAEPAESFAVPAEERESGAKTGTAARPAEKARGPALASKLHSDDEAWLAAVRDGFRAPETWIPQPVIEEEKVEAADEGAIFRNSHHLTALNRGRVPGAIVNGRILTIGHEIDGWKLIEVGEATAVFERGELRVELVLAARAGVSMTPTEAGPPEALKNPGSGVGQGTEGEVKGGGEKP